MCDKYNKAKADAGDILVEQNCESCEFNFGTVCAGHGTRKDNGKDTYGMSIDEAGNMFENGCDDWGISLDSFIEQEKMNGR